MIPCDLLMESLLLLILKTLAIILIMISIISFNDNCDHSRYYSESCYIVLYKYTNPENKKNTKYLCYFWAGISSSHHHLLNYISVKAELVKKKKKIHVWCAQTMYQFLVKI